MIYNDLFFARKRISMDIQCKYKGINVPYDRESEPVAFEAAVMEQIIREVIDYVPQELVDERLEMQRSFRISMYMAGEGGFFYSLSDVLEILRKTYHDAGVRFDDAELRHQAMEITIKGFNDGLFSIGAGAESASSDELKTLIDEGSWIYLREEDRTIFGAFLYRAVSDVLERKRGRTPEERDQKALEACIFVNELEEKSWNAQFEDSIRRGLCEELILDHVAEAENISATDEEVWEMHKEILRDIGFADPEEYSQSKEMQEVDPDTGKTMLETNLEGAQRQLLRRKAKQLILDSAVSQPW